MREALRQGGPNTGSRMTPSAIGSTTTTNVARAESANVPFGTRSVSLQAVQIRMRSVGNIQKITKAMKMVAASRLKGAEQRAKQSRALVQPFVRLLGDAPGTEVEGETLIVPITSDKGLCGGINTTVVKYAKLLNEMNEGKTSMDIVGDKARAQITRLFPDKINDVIVDTTKQPLTFATASGIADAIMAKNKPKTQIIYNRFQSAISFKPTVATILSNDELEKVAEEGGNAFDTYEIEGPDRSEFLLDLAEFKMGAVLFNAMLENNTSELGSRMQSMENSSKNAGEMLNKLTLLYNRTRQAAITTELIEIISGASALEAKK
jgi:F-type H+-transporting ATPase subunit gamma